MKEIFNFISAFFSIVKVFFASVKKIGNKQFFIYILFLLISTMFWFLQSLNNKEVVNISLPLEYANIPKDMIFAKLPPQYVDVQLRDKGMNLLNYSLRRNNPIKIDMSNFPSKKGKVVISRDKLLATISDELKSSTELVNLYSDSLVLVYANKEGVKVPVKLNSNITISHNCIQKEDIELSPSEVTIYADSSIMMSISEVETELLVLNNLAETKSVNVKLKDIYGVKIEPEEVIVKVPIENLIPKTLSLPIVHKNFPENVSVITFPANAEVKVMVPMSKYNETDNSKFRLDIDYKHYKYNMQKLPLILSKYPDYVEQLSIAPDSVEYIIEKKELSEEPINK